MSTVALYKTGLGAYAQGKDALAMLSDAPRMIAGLIARNFGTRAQAQAVSQKVVGHGNHYSCRRG